MTSRAECAAQSVGLVLGDHAHTTDPGVDALDSAKSIMRNLPPKCTAGFAAYWLNPSGGYHVLPPVSGQRFQWQLARQH